MNLPTSTHKYLICFFLQQLGRNPRTFVCATDSVGMTSALYSQDSDSKRLVKIPFLEAPIALTFTSVSSLPHGYDSHLPVCISF